MLLLFFLFVLAPSIAQIRLWEGDAPGAHGSQASDIPTLTVFLPSHPAHRVAAVIICPGGGYMQLAAHEGEDYARFLSKAGMAALVLRYRLGSDGYRHPAPLEDGLRAIRYVRANAHQWSVDPDRIGIMGSSAGGHLASTVLTHWDSGKRGSADAIERVSSRPDFGILCYAVISMGPNTHEGSRNALLGKNPDSSLIVELSNEQHVTARTPPCFLWHTYDDETVKVENTLEFAAALRRWKVPFDLHVFVHGRHGIGLGDREPFDRSHPWTKDLLFWLREMHISEE